MRRIMAAHLPGETGMPSFLRTAIAAAVLLAASQAWAMGSQSNWAPDMSEIQAMVDRGDYEDAISELRQLVESEPRNADAYNYLGYSYRKLKDYPNARTNYDKALTLDPDHKGAHEYIGELFVETGDMPAAERHLAALERICGTSCQEYRELAAVIARAKANRPS